VRHSNPVEKTKYEQALDLWEKYGDPDTGVIADKVVADIEHLKTALSEEKENAAAEVVTVQQALLKLSGEGKIKGIFVVGSDNEYDSYHLETEEDTAITLVLVPAADQYEWRMEEGVQFGVTSLPAFDVLHKDLALLKKSNLLQRLFNALQADTRNPDIIARLEELLKANSEKKKKALVTEWRETLEYVLTDLKDEKSGKSILIDQEFPYSKNGKTKSFRILKADRTGLLVMIDEELELDRKFPIDSYAYDLVMAFMPQLVKNKGKTPSLKGAGRSSKLKKADVPAEPTSAPEIPVEEVSLVKGQAEPA
jgi:hypothetical protein